MEDKRKSAYLANLALLGELTEQQDQLETQNSSTDAS